MQKYFNIIYAVLLVGLATFVIKTQLFGEVADVKENLQAQSESMDKLQEDIRAIVDGINTQLQASQQAAQGQLNVPASQETGQ